MLGARTDEAKVLEKLSGGLIPGETVLSIHRAKGLLTGEWLVLTDRRVIFCDIEGLSANHLTIPLRQIQWVSVESGRDKKLMGFTRLVLRAGSETFTIEFYGREHAQAFIEHLMPHIL